MCCVCVCVCVCGNFNDNWFELISCKPGGRISKVADFYGFFLSLSRNVHYIEIQNRSNRQWPWTTGSALFFFHCSIFIFLVYSIPKKKRNLIEKYQLWTRLINRYFCMLNNLISSSSSSTAATITTTTIIIIDGFGKCWFLARNSIKISFLIKYFPVLAAVTLWEQYRKLSIHACVHNPSLVMLNLIQLNTMDWNARAILCLKIKSGIGQMKIVPTCWSTL